MPWQRSRTQHEMTLCLESHDGRIHGYLEYASELFSAQTAHRLCSHYVALLDKCVVAADTKLLHLSSYTHEEYRQWIGLWNDTSRTYVCGASVGEVFKSTAKRYPERPAATSGTDTISYRDLDHWSDQIAARFADSFQRGSIAAVALPPGLKLAAVMLGLFKAGLIYLPLDEGWPEERVAAVLRAVDVHVVVGSASYIERVRPFSRLQWSVADVMPSTCASNKTVVPGVDGRQPAYLLFTSGSTGAPKGVLVSHASLVNYASGQNELLGLNQEDVMLQQAAITFDVFFEEVIAAWLAGAKVVFREQDGPLLTARDIFQFVAVHGITCINMVTAHWHALVQGMREAQLPPPPSLRWVIIGGEAVQADKIDAWRATNIPLLHLYGQTEACCDSVAYVHRGRDARSCATLPIGRPMGNTQVYILDAWMNPAPIGSYGEIFIGGAGVAIGYPGRARDTAQKFVPDPFCAEPGRRLCRTGDLGRINVAGELEFAGRADSQAKIRGYRIEPGEIEAAIATHPNVKDVVVALQGPVGDQHLVAYCVAGDGPSESSRKMRDWLSELLPKHCVPAFIMWIDAIPMNANGKVDRRMLPPPRVERDIIEPRNALEATLHDIWCECLSRESLSVDDEFMDVGGHSLSMARIASRIERTLGLAVPLQDLFGAQTIERQAQLLLSYQSSGRAAVNPELCSEGTMLTLRLDAKEIDHVESLLTIVGSRYSNETTHEFLDDAPHLAHQLPERLCKFMAGFRYREPDDGVCLISGVPIDPARIGATPKSVSDPPDAARTRREHFLACLTGSLLGDCFGWATQQNSKIVHDVAPMQEHEDEQISSGSLQVITLHNEDAFHENRADYLCLMCLRNPDAIATTYSRLDAAQLSEEHRALLSDPVFRIRPDYSHQQAHDLRAAQESQRAGAAFRRIQDEVASGVRIQVLSGDRDRPYLRLDPYFMDEPESQEHRQAFAALCNLLQRNTGQVVLQAGDLLFLDNYRVVHGRNAFRARYDGQDRWLKRVNITRDLRRSRALRPSVESRIIY
jgi:Fe(II)/alpha-ketoglutarate-dependent arginine beta-hydroxylase